MKLHPFTTRLRMAGATLATVLLLSACGSSSTPAASSSTGNSLGLLSPGKIEAAAGTDQPPFAFADANGKPEGFIIDITNEVAKRLGLTVEYKSTTVPAALAGLTSGQYDLAASGLGVTSERLKSVAFSKGLFWSTTAVLTTKATSSSGLTDFAGKKVGVVTGSVQEGFVTGKMPGAVSTKFQSGASGVSQLVSGSIDAFVLGGPDAEKYLQQYSSLKVAVSAPVDHATAVAMPKTSTAFVTAWDTQVSAMIADGTFQKIYGKWFPNEATTPELVKIWPGLAAAGSTGTPVSASSEATTSGS